MILVVNVENLVNSALSFSYSLIKLSSVGTLFCYIPTVALVFRWLYRKLDFIYHFRIKDDVGPVTYFTDSSKAALLLWIFYVFSCLVFVMFLCASVYLCLVVTCWERADLLALVYGV